MSEHNVRMPDSQAFGNCRGIPAGNLLESHNAMGSDLDQGLSAII